MKRIREVGMLEWIYYIKPEYLLVVYIPQEVLENIVFTKAVRCALLGRTLALLRSSLMAILCRPGLILGEVITQFDLLTTRKIMVTAHSSNEGLFRLIIYFLSCCFCPLSLHSNYPVFPSATRSNLTVGSAYPVMILELWLIQLQTQMTALSLFSNASGLLCFMS